QQAFCREALMWRSLDHKFVLPFLGIHEIKDTPVPQFFLVSPYMKNGTLARWRKQANPPIAVIEERLLEVAQAMEYIHSEGAFHGDLRGENVLLDDNFHVKIADFGLTRLSEATNTRSGALHLNFAAPELFGISEDDDDPSDDPSPRTQMSDVYAFGCLSYEIYYDSIPFAGKTDMQILTLVSREVLPPRLDGQPLSDEAWDVIQRCWVREPLKRPRMNDVVESMIAMSQSVSPQSNADNETLREESPSSSTLDSSTVSRLALSTTEQVL
ncbi:kinase-like domain-containing protein, partial [Amanita rubescens]